jgi:DNA-directed RNA polymerase subunit RPC12/RpoP
MKNPSTKKWIEAAKILSQDSSAIVPCPELNDGILIIHDEVFRDDPTRMERYLVCNKCGARNVIRMRVPDSNKNDR